MSRPPNHVGKSGHHSGGHYISQAAKYGCQVKPGKGDHFKIWSPDHTSLLVVPVHRSLATGTECAIKSWFKRFCIPLLIFLGALGMILANG